MSVIQNQILGGGGGGGGAGSGTVTSVDVAISGFSSSGAVTTSGTITMTVNDAATFRTSIGVGTGDSPQFAAVNVGHATDTTVSRSAAGKIAVEAKAVPLMNGAVDLVFAGPTVARTWTGPDLDATLLYSGGALGTPASGTLTNCTGLPIAGTTGYGTGVATALAVNVGSAGAPVLFDGAGGTPSSLVGTNISGTGASFTAGAATKAAVPLSSKSAAYTTVLGDANTTILHPVGDNNARTFTIDSNANVAYPVGTMITFVNRINTVTIAITTDTMYLAGAGTTGSRTLAAYGVAVATKTDTTEWVISGTGLT